MDILSALKDKNSFFLSHSALASGGGCHERNYWDEFPDTVPRNHNTKPLWKGRAENPVFSAITLRHPWRYSISTLEYSRFTHY
jgi:hypothetical protein